MSQKQLEVLGWHFEKYPDNENTGTLRDTEAKKNKTLARGKGNTRHD